MRDWSSLLVISVGLVSVVVLAAAPEKKLLHPGTIVDAYTRKAVTASAYAYGSQKQDGGSGCPTYSEVLDTQRSATDGSFTFHIDAAKSGYLAVYCEAGFAPRTETTNDNSTNGKRVQPDPITLFPTSSAAGIPEQIAAVAIGADLHRLRSHFVYYQESNGEAFAVGSSKFPGRDQRILKDLMSFDIRNREGIEQDDQSSRRKVESADMAFVAIATDLNSARSDFRYYAETNGKAYASALADNFPEEKETIEAIRTRRETWPH